MAKTRRSRKVRRGFAAADPLRRLNIRRPSVHGGYGWVRDLPDARDFTYGAPLFRFPQGLPPSVDLRSEFPPVYDQGQLGSCTANSIAGAIACDQRKQGVKEFTPSRLFIYYNERAMEGTVRQDAGAQIRDGVKSVATLGAPPETDWPYDIGKFAQKPPKQAYTDAKSDLVTTYARVTQDLTQMRGCLAEGYPFVFGFTVYESFEKPSCRQDRRDANAENGEKKSWVVTLLSQPGTETTRESSLSEIHGAAHGDSMATF